MAEGLVHFFSNHWVRITLFTVAILLFTGVAGTLGYWGGKKVVSDPYFQVSSMLLKGLDRIPKSTIQKQLGHLFGQNIFLVDLQQECRDLEHHPWIRKVRMRRKLPNTVEVQLVERKPYALVLADSLYRIDREGVVLEKAEQGNPNSEPILTGLGSKSLQIGQVIDPRLINQARSILRYFKSYRFLGDRSIGWIDLAFHDWVDLVTQDGKTRIRLSGKDLEREYVYLRAVDRILAEKTDEVALVDLTFPGKVIVRNHHYRG